MRKVNILEKLSQFSDYWHPRLVGELNGQHVKLAKVLGEFPWHSHEEEDELFFIIEGELDLEFRDQTVKLSKGEFFIVPKGVEHRPLARKEAHIMLFEPASTVNTGNLPNSEFTKLRLKEL